MKLIKGLLFFLIFQNLASVAFGQAGQQNLVYNHYFINPSLYNPSYIASSGYTELYLNYRAQFVGFEGAPKTSTLNLQVPINYKSGFGVSLYNDQVGNLRTNTGLLSFAYQIYLGKSMTSLHKISFGLSAGISNSKINFNTNEPLANSKSNTSSFDGQFGLNYQLHNFKLSFALPRLLKSKIVSDNSLNSPTLESLQSAITTFSYKFNLNTRVSIEPFVLYRIEQNLPSQFELLSVLTIDNLFWVGGAYRQKYGSSAFLGFNIKEKIKVGYAYEFAPNQLKGIGNGSHELQLIIRLSKHKKERVVSKEKAEIKETTAEPIEQENVATAEPEAIKEEHEVAPLVVQKENESKESESTAPIVAEQPLSIPQLPEPVEKPAETKKLVSKTLDGDDLKPGNYVVVGAFISVANAKNYKTTLKRAGYPADVAFNPDKNYYIVHMGVTQTLDEAKNLRDVYRQKSRYSFKDTWILVIE